MKPAYIRWFGRFDGRNRRATLRTGQKGYGRVIGVIWYWPGSKSSIDATYRIFQEVADREGYEIVGADRNIQDGE